MANTKRYCQTCRLVVDNRGFHFHAISVVHRKGKLIRGLLERDRITHAEIARRIGLTRERVRQLAMQMGFATGRSRHAVWRMERQRKTMGEFFVQAQKRGFEVELLRPRSAYINGKLCIQRKACWHDLRQNKYKYTYVSIFRPAGEFDICAWKLPDGRFLILPNKLMAFRQTTFKAEESKHPGTASS